MNLQALFLVILSSQILLQVGTASAGTVVGWGGSIAVPDSGIPVSRPATGVVTIAATVLTDATKIAAGTSHSLAIKSDGTVVGWGFNLYGQATGVATTKPDVANGVVTVAGRILSNIVDVAADHRFSIALTRDGQVVVWGETNVYPALTNVISVSCGPGYNSALALKRDGTVVRIESGISPTPWLSNAVAVAVGGDHYSSSFALRANGAVVLLDEGAEDPELKSLGLSNVVAIAAGYNHQLALKQDGTVFGWGGNGSGQATGTPTTQGNYRSSGLVELDGKLLTNVVALAASDEFSLALKRDGKVVAWGKNHFHQCDVPADLKNVIAIAAGQDFCLAITTNNPPLPIVKPGK